MPQAARPSAGTWGQPSAPSSLPHRGAWTGGGGVCLEGGPYLSFLLLGITLRRGVTGRLESPHWIGENRGRKAQTRIEMPQCMAQGCRSRSFPALRGTGQEGGGPGGGGGTLSLLHQVTCFLSPDGAVDGARAGMTSPQVGLRLQPGHLGCGRGRSAVSPTRPPRAFLPAALHPLPHGPPVALPRSWALWLKSRLGEQPPQPSGSTCHSCGRVRTLGPALWASC